MAYPLTCKPTTSVTTGSGCVPQPPPPLPGEPEGARRSSSESSESLGAVRRPPRLQGGCACCRSYREYPCSASPDGASLSVHEQATYGIGMEIQHTLSEHRKAKRHCALTSLAERSNRR